MIEVVNEQAEMVREQTEPRRGRLLEGKTALVTGASRGIGRGIAEAFAREGASVAINYCGSEDKAMETKALVESFGVRAMVCRCDVGDFAQTEQMMKDVIREFGRLDILVNNAGITRDNLILRMKEEEYDQVLDTNLKGSFLTIRHGARQMVKQRAGRIINISSVSGLLGNGGQSNYSASKAGIIGLTKAVARELAGRGITVNAIAPGYISTEMTSVLPQKAQEALLGQIPLGRAGEPEDVAQAAVFLASDMAAYITGQVLSVDGGMYM